MPIISPSILSADFANLERDCRQILDAGARMLHFDVMDGHFVPNISFGVPVLKSLHHVIPDAFYDVHLMITDPNRYIEAFASAGASLINIHAECNANLKATLAGIHELGCKTGMTIKPMTDVREVFPYLEQLDLVLVMSVEPGFGGQSFMPSALKKIARLKEERQRRRLDFMIEVDGGIDLATGQKCVRSGADILVAGSAVFGAKNAARACKELAALW